MLRRANLAGGAYIALFAFAGDVVDEGATSLMQKLVIPTHLLFPLLYATTKMLLLSVAQWHFQVRLKQAVDRCL